jgi:hypothetical protein
LLEITLGNAICSGEFVNTGRRTGLVSAPVVERKVAKKRHYLME